jgi:hypothetical protein
VPQSADGTTDDTALERYGMAVVGAFEKAGYPTSPGMHLEEWFHEAGFVDIRVHKYLVPLGAWPKDKYYVCDVYISCSSLFITTI